MIGDSSLFTETPLGYIITKGNLTVWKKNILALQNIKMHYTHYICENICIIKPADLRQVQSLKLSS